MSLEPTCFIKFSQAIDGIALPERFTFPFYYQPHPLCIIAADELQQRLSAPQTWQHNFGLTDDPNNIIGKMFGVLLVKNQQGELGYLAAFSGKLAEQNHIDGFVPPVFDLLVRNNFFLTQQVHINQLNEQIHAHENNSDLVLLKHQLAAAKAARDEHIATQRADMIVQRQMRKAQRMAGQNALSSEAFAALQHQLNQQSISDKLQLKAVTLEWDGKLAHAQAKYDELHLPLVDLKNQRKQASAALQQQIFAQYQFLNAQGKSLSLQEIFSQTALRTPPAGAGECAAPKLLQYAFKHQMQPLALAEFWWGASPKSEIRQHKHHYPACLGKCQPILAHMLEGMALDPNPMLVNQGEGKHLDLIYQDEDMVIINKPAEFLSVPGKDVHDSVYARMKSQYPQATGSLIVHRLDMSTSGLMVIALNPQAHKSLQRQFIQRTIEKSYIALVTGIVQQDDGVIELPLRGDLYDRPRQLVCQEYGKPALTEWQVLSRDHVRQQTKVRLKPHTGRTHQLRVHCAHPLGLNMPIVGDDLYGTLANRLHLHAEQLTLNHPLSNKTMSFNVGAEF